MNVFSDDTPRATKAFFPGGEVLVVRGYAGASDEGPGHSFGGTVKRPAVTGHFCGRVLQESAGRGNAEIVIWKFWVALAPVGDRLSGTVRVGCIRIS